MTLSPQDQERMEKAQGQLNYAGPFVYRAFEDGYTAAVKDRDAEKVCQIQTSKVWKGATIFYATCGTSFEKGSTVHRFYTHYQYCPNCGGLIITEAKG